MNEFRVKTATIVFKSPDSEKLTIENIRGVFYIQDHQKVMKSYIEELLTVLSNPSIEVIGFECEDNSKKQKTTLVIKEDILYISFG